MDNDIRESTAAAEEEELTLISCDSDLEGDDEAAPDSLPNNFTSTEDALSHDSIAEMLHEMKPRWLWHGASSSKVLHPSTPPSSPILFQEYGKVQVRETRREKQDEEEEEEKRWNRDVLYCATLVRETKDILARAWRKDMIMAPLFVKTLFFVAQDTAGLDGSHDIYHLIRTMGLAMHIARREGCTKKREQRIAIILASLLHDVGDPKYDKSSEESAARIRVFLSGEGVEFFLISKILVIINGVSYSKEVSSNSPTDSSPSPTTSAHSDVNFEYQALLQLVSVVQDADRLEALGAIGIARAFSFGGFKKHPLWIPCADPWGVGEEKMRKTADRAACTVDHFYQKLFKLEGLMKTKYGRELANTRTREMKTFVNNFFNEWEMRDALYG